MKDKSEDDFDFGFTTVSESDFKAKENSIQSKVDQMYKMIMPLLQNLKKDADKNEYIYWPNRAAKISEFIIKLEKIIKS
jgi:hypothetical protein